jgi:hypothetical protein
MTTMMKKTFQWMLMAAVVCGLSLSFTACSDDDDDKKGADAEKQSVDPYEKQGEEATSLFRIVHLLAQTDSLPDNWKTATFEPMQGDALDASLPFVRSMAVANAEEARLFYSSLVNEDVAEGQTTHSWQMAGVGKLNFTLQNQSDCIATIDVNLNNMPHLTQLRLIPAEATGDNGHFNGEPYYHIGDVVMDKDNCYWVCVRSAYSPKKKDETHWVTMHINQSAQKSTRTGFAGNLKTYAENNKRGKHVVPTQLGGSDKRMIKYFAQLLAVMYDPNRYADNYMKNAVMENGLGDLSVAAHPMKYVTAMSNAWKEKRIWEQICPKKVASLDFRKKTSLTFFYEGYSSPWLSNNMTLYLCEQKGPCMSQQTTKTLKWNMNGGKNVKFDILDYATNGQKSDENITVAEAPNEAVVIRIATGEELNGGKSVKATEAIGKVTPVLIAKTDIPNALKTSDDNENTGTMANVKVGDFIGQNGKFYSSPDEAANDNTDVVAIVVYYDSNKKVDDTGYHGLAMALKDIENKERWVGSNYHITIKCTESCANAGVLSEMLGGISSTVKTSYALCGLDHEHKAAQMCDKIDPIEGKGFSQWFLPSTGQWIKALQSMGLTWNEGKKMFEATPVSNGETISNFLKESEKLNFVYWTSTCGDDEKAWAIDTRIKEAKQYRFFQYSKELDCKIRPFVAFDYGDKDPGESKGYTEANDTKIGTLVGTNGRFYDSVNEAVSVGVRPVAVVLCKSNIPADIDQGGNYKNLAMALFDLDEKTWGSGENKNCTGAMGSEKIHLNLNGIVLTQKLDNCTCGKNHDAADACRGIDFLQNAPFSGWFLPSTGQWVKALEAMGLTFNENKFTDKSPRDIIRKFLKDHQLEFMMIPTKVDYWTANERYSDEVYYISFNGDMISFDVSKKNNEAKHKTRPFIAF